VPVPFRKESQRGLIALAVLCMVGLATFASVASSSSGRGKDKPSAPLERAR
jgi:hypothetical protein